MNNNFSIKADNLLLIIIGQQNILNPLLDMLNTNPKEKYIINPINIPMANIANELSINNDIIMKNGVEFAQANLCAEYTDKYMIQLITNHTTHSTFGFITFEDLDLEETNPKTIIENWCKTKLDKPNIKNNIKPLTIAGIKSNILVITVEIKK